MKRNNLLRSVFFGIIFLIALSGCAGMSKEDQALWDSLPFETRLPSGQNCAGTLVKWNGNEVATNFIGFTKDPSLIGIEVSTGKEFYVKTPTSCDKTLLGDCIRNLDEVVACMKGVVGSAPNLVPVDLDGVPPSVPNAPSQGVSDGATGGALVNIPDITKYYWKKPDGTKVEFPSESEARAAFDNSLEGGDLVKTIESIPGIGLPSITIMETNLGHLDACTLPQGVVVLNVQDPYYKDSISGEYFMDVNAAVSKAESSRWESTEIRKFQRCLDIGVATTTTSAAPPAELVPLAPTDLYYGVSIDQGATYFFLKRDISMSLESMVETVRKSATGGFIQPFIRGKPVGEPTVIPPWYPPQDWCLALRIADCNNVPDVTIPLWYSAVSGYAPSKEAAILATEKAFTDPRHFPGGKVMLMSRGEEVISEDPEMQPVMVTAWELPPQLPDGFDPTLEYVSYNGVVHMTKELAINDNFLGWYWSNPKIQMQVMKRGEMVKEIKPPARFIFPVSILLILGVLFLIGRKFYLFVQRAKNGTGEDPQMDLALLNTLTNLVGASSNLVKYSIWLLLGLGFEWLLSQSRPGGNVLFFWLAVVTIAIYVLFILAWKLNLKKISEKELNK